MESDLYRIKSLLQEFVEKYEISDIYLNAETVAYVGDEKKKIKTVNIVVEV